jgi:dTDP-4-amino-4,6-dideoxygalactose transaminase
VTLPYRNPGERHIFNQYVIRARRRDELRAHLEREGVGTEVYYPLPLHEQECFAYLGHEPSDFPKSHTAAQEVLALPVYPELRDDQIEHVVRSIQSFY